MRTKELFIAGERLISSARRFGASGVSCRLMVSQDVGYSVRGDAPPDVSLSSERGCTVSVFVNGRRASVSTASLLPEDLDRLAEEAVLMAKLTNENEHLRLARPDEWPCDPRKLSSRVKELELFDGAPLRTIKELANEALLLDRVARAYPGIARAEESGVSHSRSVSVRLTSEGFRNAMQFSAYSRGTSVIAERGKEMSSGGSSHRARHSSDLRSIEECARRAGENAVLHLGAASIPTAVMPVIFDLKASPVLAGAVFSALSAERMYKRATFLIGKLGEQICSPEVTIVDDPFVKRSLGSRLYDVEYVGMTERTIVDKGKVMMLLSDIESGSRIGMRSTGHASGSSNLSIRRGSTSREALLREVGNGLLVTGLMGSGNIATGVYSVGVSGFLIERGEVTRPVNKVTIAGNLLDMLRALRPASDMSDHTRTNAPTCYVGEMTVGGK